MIPSPRILVIGIDGFNLNLINHLLPTETLPTIHDLIKTGAIGDLQSVYPTHSATAWASFITGQTPAGHGVFDFKTRMPDGRYRHAKPNPEHTLWHILSNSGFRVGVFNFPVTFPPDPVNGWLVSGMLSPDLHRFTYPSSLAIDLNHVFPDYRLDVEWTLYKNRPLDLINDLTSMVTQRAEVARYLYDRQPVDFMAVAFIATDRAQHALWQFIDPTHPGFDPQSAAKLKPAILNFYYTLDKAIASLLDISSPDTLVILLSDHGFQSIAWQFHVNDWLARRGWLSYQGKTNSLARWIRNLETPRIRQLRKRLFKDISRHVSVFSPGGTIDWEKTVAFCPWNFHQGIRINLKGRDPQGIVADGDEFRLLREMITSSLQNLRHPTTGEAVITNIYCIEDLYDGPFLADMPDLVFDLAPNFALGIHQQSLFEPTGWASGDHSLNGFILLKGNGVLPGEIRNARLFDISPTILRAFGVPIPDIMQGIPLQEYYQAQPESITNPAALEAVEPADGTLTHSEEEQLLNQLRNLGYL